MWSQLSKPGASVGYILVHYARLVVPKIEKILKYSMYISSSLDTHIFHKTVRRAIVCVFYIVDQFILVSFHNCLGLKKGADPGMPEPTILRYMIQSSFGSFHKHFQNFIPL